ncbi:DNA polymerase III subunit gamma and tau [Propionibacteriaceae bacterium G57]|uniref:DNA polymerase III subunit gamma and tau n=1 Tax=Aestuariimicrobium sp. G57 TaxID=3418485 RepID=UPI003DA779D0
MDDDYDNDDALWDEQDEGLFDAPQQDGPGLFEDEPVADVPVEDEPVAVDEPVAAQPPAEPAAGLAAPASAPRPARPEVPEAPLALYRRYRPDTFDEVIGQEHVTEPLKRALINNKVNHAYLFSGPRGCGKTTSARILARSLNCEQGPTPTPCGECRSCRDLARGGPGSIDVIEMDAASNGGVDDARDLRERAFFAPVQSRYKIYIVDEAHMVTSAGFNALLKLVEEPPPHVKFIFATTEPEKVIGTIRSRTHHYPFRLVPPKVLIGYLGTLCEKEGVQVEPEVLPLVVRAGAGSVRDSLSVLDQLLGSAGDHGVEYTSAAALLGYTPETLLDEIVDAFGAGDGQGVFATIDKVIEVGQDPRRFAEDLLRRLRDLVIVAAVPDAVSSGLIDVAGDQADRLSLQASTMGSGELTRAAEVIAKGLTDMRGTTAPRLYLELMCSRVLLPGADVDERGVHARLDRLERRLADGGVPVGRPAAEQPPVAGGGEPGVRDAGPSAPEAPSAEQPAPEPRQPQPRAPEPPVRDEQPRSLQDRQRTAGPRQRPHQPGPVEGVTPVGDDPAAGKVVPLRPQAPAAATGRPGDIDTARLRQEWPRVLEEVRNRRKFSFILLSKNAHVGEVTDASFTLVFSSTGAKESFTSGGTNDVLRDAIVETLGADLRIVPVVEDPRGGPGGGSGGGGGGQRGGAPSGGPSAGSRQPAPTRDQGSARPAAPEHQVPPAEDEPPPPPDDPWDVAPDPTPAERARAAEPSAPPQPNEQPMAAEHRDDEVLDDSGASAAELVMRELGGEVIDERER